MPCYSYLSRSKNTPPCRLWMRIWNKDWWEVVLLFFTVAEWKESFIITGHTFIQQKEEPLVPHVIMLFLHHCTCAVLSVPGFDPIECLHQFSLHQLNWIKVFTWRLFSPTESSIRLQTDYLFACKHNHWEAMQTAVIIAERFLWFHYCAIKSSAIMNTILRSLSVNYGSV